MHLSEYRNYLVLAGNSELKYYEVNGRDLKEVFNTFPRVCSIEEIKCYEIYVTNEEGVTGWDIKYVRSVDSKIKSYPLFDCIITVNDCSPDIEFFSSADDYLYSCKFSK